MTLRQKLRATAALLTPATVGLVAAIGIAGTANAQTTPSGQDFANAAADTANWILPHKSYTGNNYTPAAQITPVNVRNLRLAWKFTVDDTGPMEVSPIFYIGIMYIKTIPRR